MGNYCSSNQVLLVHGSRNVEVWADLDNSRNKADIDERVDWAIELATEYMNGRLVFGRYEVPFEEDHVPKMIQHMTALLTGVLLHDGKKLLAESRDQVSTKRKEFNRLLKQLLTGQLKLFDPLSGEVLVPDCETAPLVLESVYRRCFGATSRVTNTCLINIPSAWCRTCWCHTCICKSLILPTY